MRATRYDRYRRAQNADHFAHNSPFSAFFAEVVCTLGMTPPRAVISPPPKGVCTTSMEGTARPAGPGYGTRRLRCPWAAARPGRASRRRTQPHTATQAPPVWKVRRARLRCPWAGRGLAGLRDDAPSHAQRHKRRRCGRSGGPGCGARGRRQGLAGLRDDAPIRICHRAPLGRETGYPGGGTHTVGPGRTSHSNTSAASMEGAGGHGGPGCGARGRGGAWPGFETTHPATHSDTSAAGVEGAGGSGGPGRASRSTTPSRRLACGDLAGGRARRHPEHQRHHKQDHQPSSPPPTGTPSSPAPARTHVHAPTHHPGTTKPPGPIGAGRQWR